MLSPSRIFARGLLDDDTQHFCLGVEALGLGLADEYTLAIARVEDVIKICCVSLCLKSRSSLYLRYDTITMGGKIEHYL